MWLHDHLYHPSVSLPELPKLPAGVLGLVFYYTNFLCCIHESSGDTYTWLSAISDLGHFLGVFVCLDTAANHRLLTCSKGWWKSAQKKVMRFTRDLLDGTSAGNCGGVLLYHIARGACNMRCFCNLAGTSLWVFHQICMVMLARHSTDD